MKVLFVTTIVVAITSMITSMTAFAISTEDDLVGLQEAVRAAKENQDSISNGPAKFKNALESDARVVTPLPASKPFEPRVVMITGASVMGDPNAKVTLIEYSDYQCPYCARHFRQTMPEITKHYIDRGKVKLVMREFPIPNLYPRATTASHAALCAGSQSKYWEMHDLLFGNQRVVSDDDLRGYAVEIGLDVGRFNNCLEQEDYTEQIEKDVKEGIEIGVRGTPSFVLGLTDPADANRIKVTKFVYGARNYDFFAHEINELLAGGAEAEPKAQP